MIFSSCEKEIVKYESNLNIGWAIESITPDGPVHLDGQGYTRISESVMDTILATALALESTTDKSSEPVILVSCDLVVIFDELFSGHENNLKDNIRKLVVKSLPNFKEDQIILFATHTHTAPSCGPEDSWKDILGVDLDIMSPLDVMNFLSDRISKAAIRAWENRKPGGISYGLSHAVVGHDRHIAKFSGKSIQYSGTSDADFSHIEGYEDHSVNLLYTWDNEKKLTGVAINLACPSQVTETLHAISADFWHDTRVELQKRLGKGIYILPQCSSAGDQSPHVMVGKQAEQRMQQIMFPKVEGTGYHSVGHRKQIALRISDAVTSILPYMENHVEWSPVLAHRAKTVELSRRFIDVEYVFYNREINAVEAAAESEKKYNELLAKADNNPDIKMDPQWNKEIYKLFRNIRSQRYAQVGSILQAQPEKLPIEVHVVRIGDIVMATNPFELYLDYGIRMKGRSPAVQTFVVQLAGGGSYLPTSRAMAGGAYGTGGESIVGPEGGQELVEFTLGLINEVWK